MSKADLQCTKEAIGKILRSLDIAKVAYVDDIFGLDESQDTNEVIGWFAEAWEKSPDAVKKIMSDVSFGGPYEVWTQEVRSRWELLEANRRQEIAIDLLRLRQIDIDSEDPEHALKLEEMFPEDISFQKFSPSDWEKAEDEFLDKASASSKILCLFDQDLHNAEGYTDTGPRSGIGLLKRAVQENVFCGLLTHTIPRIEDELPGWRQLAAENDIKLEQFLPLAKVRIDNPLDFADGIKKTILNTFCEKMKKIAIDIFHEASDSASDTFRNVDPYDFEYIVLQASLREGMWEADTLIRLFQIFQRDSIRESMLGSSRSQAFNEAVQIARPISAIEAGKDGRENPRKVLDIRRQELYESDRLIRHSPLETGDIFALESSEGGNRGFILLAQPCDLMMRKEGKRSSTVVPIVEIKRLNCKEVTKKSRTYWRTHAQLNYLYKNSSDCAILEFRMTIWINTEVLDLAVLDDAGHCKLDLNSDPLSLPLHPQLTKGWDKRRKRLVRDFEKHGEYLDKLNSALDIIEDENVREELWKYVMPNMSSGSNILPPKLYSSGVFNFGLRRAERYRRPGVDRLLKAYTRFLARDADEPDFARADMLNS